MIRKLSLPALVVLGTLVLSAQAQPQKPSAAQRLVGAWQLVTRTVQANGKTLADPVLGEKPLGRLYYDASGGMMLQMMRQGRTAVIGKPANPRDGANPRAVLGYDAYFGTYTVDERAGTITHHVEASLFPEDLGKDWTRPFTLDGDTLTLRFTSPADEGAVTRTLVFRRSRLVAGQPPAPDYEVYAVRFADVPFSAGSLVAGADRARMIDIAFTVWAMKGGGRTVLLDAGFYRDKFMARWKPQHYARPSDALKTGLGLDPAQVTDIVVSHSHWDHADGVDLFPNATIWIQREEYDYYVGPSGEVLHTGGADAEDARMFASLKAAGRVKLIDGDAQQILPGLTVYTGGKHTFASQYVGVQTRSGIVVLASDNAYLYENLERHLAIAQTLDAEANLSAQARMLKLAAAPRFVIPGHDPAVFDRFPKPGNGVARID